MSIKRLTYSSVLIAIGVILPIMFHVLPGNAGMTMLPIHYSAYLGGGLLGPLIGGIVGLLTPLVSFVTTGMPPYPGVIFIAIETAVYGIVFGYLYFNKKVKILISLVVAMVVGRLTHIIASYLIGSYLFDKSLVIADTIDSMAIGIIGVVYQLVIIPLVISRLEDFFNSH